MSDLKLCPTCDGTGAISDLDTRSLAGAFPEILVDCPSDCIPTALGEFEHFDPYTGEYLGSELIIVHLDPVHHALWCKTHRCTASNDSCRPEQHCDYAVSEELSDVASLPCVFVVVELIERGYTGLTNC